MCLASSKARLSWASHHRRPATPWYCRPSCRPPHRRGRPARGLVMGCETERNEAPHRQRKSTFTLGAAPMGQHNASSVRPAIGCWYTSLSPVLSCLPWKGNFVRCVLTGDTRLARAELLGDVDIVEGTRRRRVVMRVETRSTYTHEATKSSLQSVHSQLLCDC